MWSTCSSPCVALNCRQRRSRMSHSALHAALHTSLFAEQTTQANALFPGCEATIQGCLRSRKRLVRLLPSALAESSLPAAKRLMTLEAGTIHKRSLTNSVWPILHPPLGSQKPVHWCNNLGDHLCQTSGKAVIDSRKIIQPAASRPCKKINTPLPMLIC